MLKHVLIWMGKYWVFFCNSTGLMQGEVLSPFLSNMYVNDLEMIFILIAMFALWNFIIELTYIGLCWCCGSFLWIDRRTSKSFRWIEWILYCIIMEICGECCWIINRDFSEEWEGKNWWNWVFRNPNIESVVNFTHLGIVFKFNNTFLKAEKLFKPEKLRSYWRKMSKTCNYLNLKTLLFLLNCYIHLCPIVYYGSEI